MQSAEREPRRPAAGEALKGAHGGKTAPCPEPDRTRWLAPGPSLLAIGLPLALAGTSLGATNRRPVRVERVTVAPLFSGGMASGAQVAVSARF